jgi:hypothetical protein
MQVREVNNAACNCKPLDQFHGQALTKRSGRSAVI